MDFLDLTLPGPAENLALDEALLLQAEAGELGEVLRLWDWSTPAVILGSGCQLAADVDEDRCLADGVPILRRASGGGTVLLGRGCLLFSLVLAYDRSPAMAGIGSSYQYILGRIQAALQSTVPGIELAGTSDLAVAGRKFSGNAQQRKRGHLLHHGTLLYDFAIDRVACYLRVPARQPDYRGHREHAAFLVNLPLGREALVNLLRSAWSADTPAAKWPEELVQRLTHEKYLRPEWIRRRR